MTYSIGLDIDNSIIRASVWNPLKKRFKILKHGKSKARFLDDNVAKGLGLSYDTNYDALFIYIKRLADDYLTPRYLNAKGKSCMAIDSLVISIRSVESINMNTIRQSAERAGFLQISFLEPAPAVAMAYGLTLIGSKTILVADLTSSTTTLSILQIDGGSYHTVTSKDLSNIYNKAINDCIRQYILSNIHPTSIASNVEQSTLNDDQLRALDIICDQAKEDLIHENTSTISLSSDLIHTISPSISGCKTITIDAGVYDTILQPISQSLYDHIHHILSSSSTISEVVLCGENSRISSLRSSLCHALRSSGYDDLGKDGLEEICYAIDGREAVVRGLAIYGALNQDNDAYKNEIRSTLMIDQNEHDIGIIVANDDEKSSDEVFMPLFMHGVRLPAISRYNLMLSPPIPSRIEVGIYEPLDPELYDTISSSTASDVMNDDVIMCDDKRYVRLTSCDVMLPKHHQLRVHDEKVSIALKFQLSQQKQITVTVEHPTTPSSNRLVSSEISAIVLLVVAIVVYIYSLIAFPRQKLA